MGSLGSGNVMTDGGEFKTLVRQRAAVTGEKYIQAYRALLNTRRIGNHPGHRSDVDCDIRA